MTPSGTRLIITSVAIACACFLVLRPRAIFPVEGPTLSPPQSRANASSSGEIDDALDKLSTLRKAEKRVALSNATRRFKLKRKSFVAQYKKKGGNLDALRQADNLRVLEQDDLDPLKKEPAEDDVREFDPYALSALDYLARYQALQRGELKSHFTARPEVLLVLLHGFWNQYHGLAVDEGMKEKKLFYLWPLFESAIADKDLERALVKQARQSGAKLDDDEEAYISYRQGLFQDALRRYSKLGDSSIYARNIAAGILLEQ